MMQMKWCEVRAARGSNARNAVQDPCWCTAARSEAPAAARRVITDQKSRHGRSIRLSTVGLSDGRAIVVTGVTALPCRIVELWIVDGMESCFPGARVRKLGMLERVLVCKLARNAGMRVRLGCARSVRPLEC